MLLKKKDADKALRKMSMLPSADLARSNSSSPLGNQIGSSGNLRNGSFTGFRNGSSANFAHGSSDSLHRTNTRGNSFVSPGNSIVLDEITNKKVTHFLAVWSGGRITPTPKLIQLDSPIKSITIGDTDGPDKIDICVMGLEDGRVLICSLPFPIKLVEVVQSVTPNLRMSLKSRQSFMGNKKYSISSGGSQSSSDNNSTAHTVSTRSTALTRQQNTKNFSSGVALLSFIPEEESSINVENSIQSPIAKTTTVETLNEAYCRSFRLHLGAVNQVSISRDGLWIFTGGSDGCIFMLTTSKKGKEMAVIPHRAEILEDNFLVIDKSSIHTLRKNYNDALHMIEIEKKEGEMAVNKITTSKDKIIAELEAKMKKEIHKRDETIVQGRLDYIHLNNIKREEIQEIEKKSQYAINDMELMYQRKLAQESLYLDKMRQAYDEYVLHSKLDLSEAQTKAEKKLLDLENEKKHIEKESEKQKTTVLQYFDYVKLQNNEVLNGLETSQEEERL